MGIIWRVISREVEGGEGAGIKKYNWEEENRQGDVKHSIEKGEFKELICTTHGHKLRGLLLEGRGVPGREGQREKTGTAVTA